MRPAERGSVNAVGDSPEKLPQTFQADMPICQQTLAHFFTDIASRLTAKSRDRLADLGQDFLSIGRTETRYRLFFQLEKGHQVLAEHLKNVRVLAAANTFVALKHALRNTRLHQVDIANDAQL
jgi:hypothetical protein